MLVSSYLTKVSACLLLLSEVSACLLLRNFVFDMGECLSSLNEVSACLHLLSEGEGLSSLTQ